MLAIQEDKNQDFRKVCKTKTSKTPENYYYYYYYELYFNTVQFHLY